MNEENKRTIDSLIEFKRDRKPFKLGIDDSQMSFADLMSAVQDLLNWHKKVFLGLSIKEFIDLTDLKEVKERLERLFELIPDLKSIFHIESEKLVWSDQLSIEEQDEIRNYINENYRVVMKIRRFRL